MLAHLEPAHLCVRSGSRTRFGPCFSPNLGISGGFTLGSLIGRTVAALHEDGRPSLHLFHELGMTLGERVELIVAALIGPHRLAHGRKGRAQALEARIKLAEILDLVDIEPLALGKTDALGVEPELAPRLEHAVVEDLPLGAVVALRAAEPAGLHGDVLDVIGREARAEEARGNAGQLVRLVDHGERRLRQHAVDRIGLTLEGHRAQIEMVVHHDDLTLHGVLAGLLDEAVVVVRTAVLAEAVFARARHEGPEAVVLGHVGEFRSVARAADRRKALDLPELQIGVLLGEPAFGGREFEAEVADVVGASLEKRDLDGHAERIAQGGKVLGAELVLKRLACRRDDAGRARKERGRQIGEGLARARPRLGDENGLLLDRAGRLDGELALPLAHAEALDGLRERALFIKGECNSLDKRRRGVPETRIYFSSSHLFPSTQKYFLRPESLFSLDSS